MSGARGGGLIARWDFTRESAEPVGVPLRVRAHRVRFRAEGPRPGLGAAAFDGEGSFLEVADDATLHWGTHGFTLASWVHTDATDRDVVGDLFGKFDPDTRSGIHLGLLTSTGMTSTAQPNYRNLHFGIDGGSAPRWEDCGRPGRAVLIAALKVADGALYAGTLETGATESGRLWRYDGDRRWTDLGNPVGCNVVHSVAQFDGALYCGLGRFMGEGSALGALPNRMPGGQVYRVTSDGRWTYCGHPGAEDATPEDVPTVGYASGKADDAFALTVYRGRLYGVSNHRRGAFVYEGGDRWTYVGPDCRILSLAIHQDSLYALINGGPVYRYEGGSEWTFCGCPAGSTQTYGAVTSEGRLYVGTWPEGEVHRYDGGEAWTALERVGYEREIMAMGLYNGKVYVGSLPMANVWRLDGERFQFLATLDQTPAPLRRVWAMAVYQGRLFAGTLPAGRVWAMETGTVATWDHAFPAGWHHVAAVRDAGILRIYVDGVAVAASDAAGGRELDVTTGRALTIGFGANAFFRGRLADVRLYDRPLDAPEIAALAAR